MSDSQNNETTAKVPSQSHTRYATAREKRASGPASAALATR